MILDAKHLREVMPEGIHYIDESGDAKFIDFAMCFENFIKLYVDVGITPSKVREGMRKSKQVGVINYIGDIQTYNDFEMDFSAPYVEFYTNSEIRFEFANHSECANFHEQLRMVGWYVFDLSD